MAPDPFLQVKSRGDRSLDLAISCSLCVDNDCTKGIDGAISQRSVGGTTERWYIKKILRNARLLHDGCIDSR